MRIPAFAVLTIGAVVFGTAAGALQWQVSAHREAAAAVGESVTAARDATAKILSYRADTADADLHAALDGLTGEFLKSYSELIDTVVIPGARKRGMSAAATVVGAASVSASPAQAVALVFVDQTTTVAGQAPTRIPSTVRVELDRVGDRWLVSGFKPV